MRRLIVGLFGFAFCITAHADTINVNWIVDGNTYDTSTCTVGGDLILPTPPTPETGYHFVGWEVPEYAKLEYIESTGTQYINTRRISYENTDILKTKVRATDAINTQFITFQNPAAGVSNIGLFITGSTVFYQYASTQRISRTFNANTDYTLEASNGYLTINGSKTTGTSESAFTVNTYLLIGAANNNISGIEPDSRMFKGRIYYYKYEDKNGTVLFDGIPARRNSDNVLGMYDTVSGTFFTNAGTGVFIAGPETGEYF